MKSSNQGAVNKHTSGPEFLSPRLMLHGPVDRHSCAVEPESFWHENRVAPSETSAVKKFEKAAKHS
jgi:hypothetical protein